MKLLAECHGCMPCSADGFSVIQEHTALIVNDIVRPSAATVSVAAAGGCAMLAAAGRGQQLTTKTAVMVVRLQRWLYAS